MMIRDHFKPAFLEAGLKSRALRGSAKSVVVINKVRSNTLFGRQNFSVLVENFCEGAIPTAPFVIPYKEAYGRLPAILWEEQRGRALSYVLAKTP